MKLITVEWKCGKFSQLSASHTIKGERISDEGESCVCVCVCIMYECFVTFNVVILVTINNVSCREKG